MYVWFHTYRPVGPDAEPSLALSPEQQRRVRQFVVDTRAEKPIGVIDAYYDHQGQSLCPAATGISHHIGPWGDVEPCPIVQFATESIEDKKSLWEIFNGSAFLRDFRTLASQSTRGCIVLERPDLIEQLVEKHSARDSTARGTAREELAQMQPRPSQWDEGHEIPERSAFYRFAKKHWFHDFGAYDEGFPLRREPAAHVDVSEVGIGSP